MLGRKYFCRLPNFPEQVSWGIFFLNLGHNCFKILCWFRLCNKVKSVMYIHNFPLSLGPPSYHPHHTHLGCHGALNRVP